MNLLPLTVYYKVGDTLPALEMTVLGADGNPVDLNGNQSVTFNHWPVQTNGYPTPGGAVVSRTATVVNPSLGRVRVGWNASDFTTAGMRDGELVVVFPGGRLTSPGGSYIRIVVLPGSYTPP